MTLVIVLVVLWGVVLAAVGAWLTKLDAWYYGMRKPSWQPPDWLFGPAWSLIFTLAAWAAYRGWSHVGTSPLGYWLIATYLLNAALNMLWSALFFRAHRPDWALLEVPALWGSIVAMMAVLWPLDTLASLLVLPYLLWVTFATVLNRAIVVRNHPFTKAGGPMPSAAKP
jgi:tryptophan-rich sensory protein